MSAMAVVIQAMVWMGLPQPPLWQLILYMLCIGMFGVGVGMLYTPILVDRLQLTFPSGLAVANILRALTDPVLLKQSVSRLFGGMALGIVGGIGAAKVALLGAIDLSTSTFGAGMIVGARIGLAALAGGLVSWAMIPYFVSIGWLKPGEPFRKITFLIALGMIMGAAIIDVSLILFRAWQRDIGRSAPRSRAEQEDWKRTNFGRLVAWVVFWGVGIVVTGSLVLHQPVGYLVFAVLLVFVFAMVNGISIGIVDQNPISSAFVVTVILMAAIGLQGSDGRADGGDRAARVHERGLRHAAGPLDGLAARHQPHDPVPLSGRRHRHGRDHGGRIRQALHERISGAHARPDDDCPRISSPRAGHRR